MIAAIEFYDVVVAVHVVAIVAAFGVTFAYPLLNATIAKQAPASLPGFHTAMLAAYRKLVTPAATVALVAGVYLASDKDLWDKPWVTIPFVVLIVLLGLTGAVFTPLERKLIAAAEQDPQGAAYRALSRRGATFGGVANLLVVVAIFLMVVKPG